MSFYGGHSIHFNSPKEVQISNSEDPPSPFALKDSLIEQNSPGIRQVLLSKYDTKFKRISVQNSTKNKTNRMIANK